MKQSELNLMFSSTRPNICMFSKSDYEQLYENVPSTGNVGNFNSCYNLFVFLMHRFIITSVDLILDISLNNYLPSVLQKSDNVVILCMNEIYVKCKNILELNIL